MKKRSGEMAGHSGGRRHRLMTSTGPWRKLKEELAELRCCSKVVSPVGHDGLTPASGVSHIAILESPVLFARLPLEVLVG